MRSVLVTLLLACFLLSSCGQFPESCFNLSSDSRLPKWFSLPDGSSRESTSVTMCYYVGQKGRTATFILRGAHDAKLAEVTGDLKGLEPQTLKNTPVGAPSRYPSYEVVTVNGVTEVVEHRRMEPIFYVNDNTTVWAQLGVSR